MQSIVQCLFRIKMTAICLKMTAKLKMAAKIEFVQKLALRFNNKHYDHAILSYCDILFTSR